MSSAERAELEQMRALTAGPTGLGPWLVWAARTAFGAEVLPASTAELRRRGTADTSSAGTTATTRPGTAARPGPGTATENGRGTASTTRRGTAPAPSSGTAHELRIGTARAARAGTAHAAGAGTAPAPRGGTTPAPRRGTTARDRDGTPLAERVVLDLCAGSGAWSEPYARAGYDVRRVTLPELDVRLFTPPDRVWGVLAAPPCTEFSLARNASSKARELLDALELVSACLRIVAVTRPRWWALENPIGLLSHWLGTPADTWEPYEFGDPWTKATAIWGDYERPQRGPFVRPKGSAARRSTPAARAVTPPGFARAFFAANP